MSSRREETARLNRDQVDMDASGFRQDAQIVRIGGQNVIAICGQAHHAGVDGIGLATAGQQRARPPSKP
jgi:hypothetical protein